MKVMFYVLAAIVAIFALWALVEGVQAYFNGEGFKVTSFGIAIVGIALAGLWFKRAKSM